VANTFPEKAKELEAWLIQWHEEADAELYKVRDRENKNKSMYINNALNTKGGLK
jgi:hypothetical protein